MKEYTATAKVLHWAMALLVFGMLASGLIMEEMGFSPLKFQIIQTHKSIGLVVLMLLVMRLSWRLTHPAPMLPEGLPQWQKMAAHGTHALLYALMLFMPVSGWLMSDAAGYHPTLFGLPVPLMLAEPNREWARFLGDVHEWGGNLLIALLVMHIGAALMHAWRKDGLMGRMLPRGIFQK